MSKTTLKLHSSRNCNHLQQMSVSTHTCTHTHTHTRTQPWPGTAGVHRHNRGLKTGLTRSQGRSQFCPQRLPVSVTPASPIYHAVLYPKHRKAPVKETDREQERTKHPRLRPAHPDPSSRLTKKDPTLSTVPTAQRRVSAIQGRAGTKSHVLRDKGLGALFHARQQMR